MQVTAGGVHIVVAHDGCRVRTLNDQLFRQDLIDRSQEAAERLDEGLPALSIELPACIAEGDILEEVVLPRAVFFVPARRRSAGPCLWYPCPSSLEVGLEQVATPTLAVARAACAIFAAPPGRLHCCVKRQLSPVRPRGLPPRRCRLVAGGRTLRRLVRPPARKSRSRRALTVIAVRR